MIQIMTSEIKMREVFEVDRGNTMRKIRNGLVILVTSLLLISCGGGGGDGGAVTGPGSSTTLRISLTTVAASIPANTQRFPALVESEYVTPVNVRLTNSDNSSVADGTQVTVNITGTGAFLSDRLNDGNTPLNLNNTISVGTVGGIAQVFFHSGQTVAGTVTVRASANDPSNASRSVSGQTTVNITEDVNAVPLIEFVVQFSELPVNQFGVLPFVGSPFMSSVVVKTREFDRTAIPGGTVVNGGVESNGPIWVGTPDDGGGDFNEFTGLENDPEDPNNPQRTIFASQPEETTGDGVAQFFINALDRPGVSEFFVSYQAEHPDTGLIETISSTISFTVTDSGSTGLPENVVVNNPGLSLHVEGSGGLTSRLIEIQLLDGALNPVTNTVGDGFAINNLRVELIGDGPRSGESLSSTNAQGNVVEGSEIETRTVNGIANVNFRSGTDTGSQTVRFSADRRDNNIDNGIQDPVFADVTFVISDGRLFSVQIVSPNTNNVRINAVSSAVAVPFTGQGIPFDPDGSYGLTVSVLATDRSGNPVIQGTEIQFGLLDSPLVEGSFPASGPGTFALSGTNGNPNENGTTFNAPGGLFTSAGGGAGPGDSLVIFGEESVGNRDLESRRIVGSVNSDTSLTVTSRFNFNDDTGVSVNNGFVLPYAIGRATKASIGGSGFTDANGIASVNLNYPANILGHSAIIWAQGNGDVVDNEVETVADVESVVYPGAGILILTANPTNVTSNTSTEVLLCVTDAVLSPVQGLTIAFQVTDSFGANISVDGVSNSGNVATPTQADGCTMATLSSQGVLLSTDINIDFFAGTTLIPLGGCSTADDACDTVRIEGAALNSQQLIPIPPRFVGDQANAIITLRLRSSSGQPIEGTQILLQGDDCSISGGDDNAQIIVLEEPGITDVNGETITRIRVTGLNGCDSGGEATCTFSTASNLATAPRATVIFTGFALSVLFSPPPPQCATEDSDLTVVALSTGMAGGTGRILGPSGIDCDEMGTGTCDGNFTPGTTIVLVAEPSGTSTFTGWGGDCSGMNLETSFDIDVGSFVCTATFDD